MGHALEAELRPFSICHTCRQIQFHTVSFLTQHNLCVFIPKSAITSRAYYFGQRRFTRSSFHIQNRIGAETNATILICTEGGKSRILGQRTFALYDWALARSDVIILLWWTLKFSNAIRLIVQMLRPVRLGDALWRKTMKASFISATPSNKHHKLKSETNRS